VKTAAIIYTARQKGIKALAWISLLFAVLGGTAGAGMFLGQAVRGIFEVFTDTSWGKSIPVVLLVGLSIGLAVDLIVDMTPNQMAIWSAILIPSIASAAPGGFGGRITDWTTTLMSWFGDSLSDELGSGAPSVVALSCIVASLVMARRVITKSAGR